MSLLYALSQGLAGAARAGAGMADQQIKEDAEARMADRKLSDQLRLDAAREAMQERADDRRRGKNKADEEESYQLGIKRAPEVDAVKAASIKSEAMAKLDPELQALQVKAKTEALTQEEQAKLDFYEENKGAILKKKRDEARATHIDDSAGLRGLQMESAKLTLDEKKKVTGLIEEYENTTDPKRKAQVREALITRGVLKPSSGEFDTEKVIEKTSDMATGKETTVERTQRRSAGAEPKPTGPTVISSKAEYDKLPSGTRFTAPDGRVRIKP